MRTWEEIKDKALNSTLHLLSMKRRYNKRTLRDTYDNDTKTFTSEGNETYQKAKKFMKELMPKKCKKYKKI